MIIGTQRKIYINSHLNHMYTEAGWCHVRKMFYMATDTFHLAVTTYINIRLPPLRLSGGWHILTWRPRVRVSPLVSHFTPPLSSSASVVLSFFNILISNTVYSCTSILFRETKYNESRHTRPLCTFICHNWFGITQCGLRKLYPSRIVWFIISVRFR